MKISLSALQKASSEFKASSLETEMMMDRLQKVIKELESSWEDAGQQAFFQHFQEWRTHISGISHLLDMTANELDGIVARYIKADGDQ